MTTFNANPNVTIVINTLTYKVREQYRFAGQWDALVGSPAYYGPHFGMRSTCERAKREYHEGYNEVVFHLTHGDREPINGDYTGEPFSPFQAATTTFHVYYMRSSFFSDGIFGAKTTDLAATHVHLQTLALPGGEAQLERVFHMMQAEIWSPNGEARPQIEAKGLTHTSMSRGDVVVVGGVAYIVSTHGFTELPADVLRNI
jgi:hypothetical protein